MPKIAAQVNELARFPGVHGCALVEVDSGMVWHAAGERVNFERVGEAAVEFWRIHSRLKGEISNLGQLKTAMFAFDEGFLALTPCATHPPLLLVVLARQREMDWTGWNVQANHLREMMAASALQ